jgi:hypothetical protein
MNPLESLKEKLKIKPKVEIYKPVEIVLKEKEITKETETKTEEEQEELKPQTIGEKKRKRVQIQAPTIVEEIDVQFDREALLKKLAENKLAKVI